MAIKAVRRTTLTFLLVSLLLLGGAFAAHAEDTGAEADFTSRISQERSSRGIPQLSYSSDLVQVARRHAERMAVRGEPYHNPNLGSDVQGWTVVAENVGVGGDVRSIHDAFMVSPKHRDNVLRREVSQVGVGVVRSSDGRIWVVELFRQPEQAAAAMSPAPAPAPAPRPAPAPAPATPTTVSPPTTVAPTTTTVAPQPSLAVASSATPEPLTVVAAKHTSPVIVPEVAAAAREVPLAAWIAALMLVGVVGAQGFVVRRLQLVPTR